MNPSNDLIEECLNKENIKLYEYSCFKYVRFIGEGAYAKVHRAALESDGVIVALKSFKNNVDIEEVVKEFELHNRVNMYSNIIRLYGATKNEVHQDLLSLKRFLSTNDEQTMSRIDPDIQQIQQVPLSLQGSSTNGEPVINRIGQYIQHVQQVPLSTNGEQTMSRIDPGIQQIQKVPLSLQGSSTNGEQVIQEIQHVRQVPLSTNGEQAINRS
ncbi:14380_t:CDS:2 [Dentiscutata erythropus]|uniref:14380_t:CDS:1 n=1 Tax=Dentiscutata erythropus TaxID=1348616 RepID=A0A9N9AIC3_9GLOM|nr:14380_t:CDS:2 [Dentiscutata erythropus]